MRRTIIVTRAVAALTMVALFMVGVEVGRRDFSGWCDRRLVRSVGGPTHPTQPTQPTNWTRAADGCRHVYLDLGSNSGVQTMKLYDGEKYAGKVKGIFREWFGPPQDRSHNAQLCSFGWEANKIHHPRLLTMAKAYALRGVRVHFFHAAVGNREDRVRFYHDSDQEEGDPWFQKTRSFSLSHSASLKQSKFGYNEVAMMDVAEWIMSNVVGRRIPPPRDGVKELPPAVVMKLDIEGAEFEVLPRLALTGALCAVNELYYEIHKPPKHIEDSVLSDLPLVLSELVKAGEATTQAGSKRNDRGKAGGEEVGLQGANRCRIQIANLDDEYAASTTDLPAEANLLPPPERVNGTSG